MSILLAVIIFLILKINPISNPGFRVTAWCLKDNNNVVFGTISRLDPIKNQSMILRAFASAIKTIPNIQLLIVGDGPERNNLQALSITLGISRSVIFTGFQANPHAYLNSMDVFLLPSFSEGTSMTLLEAMSFSKPTIATSVGGTPEIIKDNDSGILISNNDESALYNAIIKLAKKPALRHSYGKNARQHFLNNFTVSNMCQQYEKLYLQCDKSLQQNR